jgi:K+-transporting ATPase ATPase C chain
MRRNLITAVLYTVVTTVLFGLVYPFVVTGFAQVLFKDKANGQLLQQNGQLVGSRIIGQPFTAPDYFHSRPSAAGTGYDAANSSGSNYAPTNKKLIDRVAGDVTALQLDHRRKAHPGTAARLPWRIQSQRPRTQPGSRPNCSAKHNQQVDRLLADRII